MKQNEIWSWEYSVVTIIGQICFVCCVDWGILKYRFFSISAETPDTPSQFNNILGATLWQITSIVFTRQLNIKFGDLQRELKELLPQSDRSAFVILIEQHVCLQLILAIVLMRAILQRIRGIFKANWPPNAPVSSVSSFIFESTRYW